MNLGMKIVPTFGKEIFISLEMDPQFYMGVSSIHIFWKKTNLIEAMCMGQKTPLPWKWLYIVSSVTKNWDIEELCNTIPTQKHV